MKVLSLVIADDHPIVRQGLRAVLDAEPDFHVVGEAGNGLEAMQAVERLKPDILILDLMMPQLSGLPVVQQIGKQFPATRVIILSMHRDEGYVLQALRHGAGAYVLKDSGAAELIQAVRAVALGQRYLSSPLTEHAIEAYVEKAKETKLDSYEMLTAREREVLQLAAEGGTNAEIAERLFISPRTAETHRAHLMQKLGLHSQTDLIRYAIRRGIIPLDE